MINVGRKSNKIRGFWQCALAGPDRIAVVDTDGSEINAGQLLVSSNQLVRALRNLGLRQGDSVAVFLPNAEWGEEVKAVVETIAELGAAHSLESDKINLEADLISYCWNRLAKYKIPKTVDFIEKMPRDPNGKLCKRKLGDPYWSSEKII